MFFIMLRKMTFFIIFIVSSANIAFATDYFVSFSHGNDSNLGTSVESPLQTLAKASLTYSPGDIVYFKRGDVWSGERLKISGSGESGNPIRIDAYGSGDLPEFTNHNNPVLIEESSYIQILHLKITDAGEGIKLRYDHDFNNKNVVIKDCYIDYCDVVGIAIYPVVETSQKNLNILETLLVTGCTIDHCGYSGFFNYLTREYGSYNSFRDVKIKDCIIRNCLFGANFGYINGGTINNNYFLLDNSDGAIGSSNNSFLSSFDIYSNTIERY